MSTIVCGSMHMLNQVKSVKNSYNFFCSFDFSIIYVNIKIPAIAKQSNSEEIIDNSSVNSSTKAGESILEACK